MSRIGHIGWMAALVVLTACNPLTFDPQVSFPGFEVGRARITSSAPVWVEARVTGADGHAIYALGAVRHADLTGPLTRACIAAGETVPCEDVLGDVRQPDQSVLAGDGSWSRLLTVWPDEVVEVWLVCIDDATQDLSCPTTLRLGLRTVDDAGDLVGDLTPSA